MLGSTNLTWVCGGVWLGVGIAVVLGAADGMYGICKGKACHLCTFQIFVIICMVLFIGVSVILVFAPDIVFEGTCTQSDNAVIEEANSVYKSSAQYFCQPGCPCALDTTSAAFGNNYNLTEQAELRAYTIDMVDGKKDSIDCLEGKNLTDA